MRKLSSEEKRQRGCEYCIYAKKMSGWKVTDGYLKQYLACRYDTCPFKDLDSFKTYKDYLKSKGALYINDERRR